MKRSDSDNAAFIGASPTFESLDRSDINEAGTRETQIDCNPLAGTPSSFGAVSGVVNRIGNPHNYQEGLQNENDKSLGNFNAVSHGSDTQFSQVPETHSNSGRLTEEVKIDKNLYHYHQGLQNQEFFARDLGSGISNKTASESQTGFNPIPRTHSNFGGGLMVRNTIGNVHQQGLQNIAREGIGTKLVTGRNSHGGARAENRRGSFYRHSKSSVLVLRKFYEEETPYPRSGQVIRLSEDSGLRVSQIVNWFSNQREKNRAKEGRRAGVNYKAMNRHPDAAINVLKAWIEAHGNASPTTEEKTQLAEQANLRLKNVSYWFENYRKNNQPVPMEVMEAGQDTSEIYGPPPSQNSDPKGHKLEPLPPQEGIKDEPLPEGWELWESTVKEYGLLSL